MADDKQQHPTDATGKPVPTDHDDGGMEPRDSRNVTGTAVTEDGRWTGAAVKPEEGPRVPMPKE